MKRICLILTITVAALNLTACLPLNFAQSKKAPEPANAGKKAVGDDGAGLNAEAQSRRPNARAENNSDGEKNSEPETSAPPPPPKPKSPVAKNEDNFVCPEPRLPCHHPLKQFDDWELSFRLPAKIVSNKTYRSAPFYAIILKKLPDGCGDLDVDPWVERERIKIQKEFPARKVFAENSCANLSAVGYEFAGKRDGEHVFYTDYIAVYAGVTEDEARELLDSIVEGYPEAEIKRMTATYEQIEM